MSARQYPTGQDRLPAAALAAITSTLVLGSVLWLFIGSASTPSTREATMVARRKPAATAVVQASRGRLASSEPTNSKL